MPAIFWLDESEPFQSQPLWWVILVSRKILSAIMFPKPNGQYYKNSELADDLNIAFRLEGKARNMYGSFTFDVDSVHKYFDWLVAKEFKRGEEELAKMVSNVLSWPKDCEPWDGQHPAYMVNQYIAYGAVPTQNQLKAFKGVADRRMDRVEAFQFAYYICCDAEGSLPLTSFRLDWNIIWRCVEPLLEDGSLMRELESLAKERMISGFVDFEVPPPGHPAAIIPRTKWEEATTTEIAEGRKKLFFERSPPENRQ